MNKHTEGGHAARRDWSLILCSRAFPDSQKLLEKVRLHPTSPLPQCGSGEEKRILGGWAAQSAAQPPTGALRQPNWGTSEVFKQFLRNVVVESMGYPCNGRSVGPGSKNLIDDGGTLNAMAGKGFS